MSAIILPVFFISITTFALAAIVDAYLRYGRKALALQDRVKRGNAAYRTRWIIAEPASLQPLPERLMERSPRSAQSAGQFGLRAAA